MHTSEEKCDLLVGSTGFVGGNLAASHEFSNSVHSTNVSDAFGMAPALCVYAGVPSAMFLANSDPEADLEIMRQARENLRCIAPRKAVLVSTIAVYRDSRGIDELASPNVGEGYLSAYGANRLLLERWVREDFPDALVVRLPALYGKGLKKNFVKDMISVAPPLLRTDKYEELSNTSAVVRNGYADRGDGFFAMKANADVTALREWFRSNDFNALSFTDSRSRFQFYSLDRLWNDIVVALEGGWDTLNLATPPFSAAELYRYVRGGEWSNELGTQPFDYDMRTIHDMDLGGSDGYICSRQDVLDGVKRFVEKNS